MNGFLLFLCLAVHLQATLGACRFDLLLNDELITVDFDGDMFDRNAAHSVLSKLGPARIADCASEDCIADRLIDAGRAAGCLNISHAFASASYWESRYSRGGHSGEGSRDSLAAFKAAFLNLFARRHGVDSVVDFGCGDGELLALLDFSQYIGVDVSPSVLRATSEQFRGDKTKSFVHADVFDASARAFDAALSIDVIYHLVEDDVYEAYMSQLFATARRFVVIYSSNIDFDPSADVHIRHRRFLAWVSKHAPAWTVEHFSNPGVCDPRPGSLKSCDDCRRHVEPGTAGSTCTSAEFYVAQRLTHIGSLNKPWLPASAMPPSRGGSGSVRAADRPTTRAVVFFGTRPEVIKLAPVIRALHDVPHVDTRTVFTGQHPTLVPPLLDLFELSVDIALDLGDRTRATSNDAPGAGLMELVNRLTTRVDSDVAVSMADDSSIWIVQGDTATAFGVALVAYHQRVRLVHIEAGLRTYDAHQPFPEEFYRYAVSRVAAAHAAPTARAAAALRNEGVPPSRIVVAGNTVIDALRYILTSNKTRAPQWWPLPPVAGHSSPVCASPPRLVIVTLHRRENTPRFTLLYDAMRRAADVIDAGVTDAAIRLRFIVVRHPSAASGGAADAACESDARRFSCVPPLDYEELHWLLPRASLLVTDSGGLQEEATWHALATLVVRNVTERPEALALGDAAVSLAGTDPGALQATIQAALEVAAQRNLSSHSERRFPFGRGDAAERIVGFLFDESGACNVEPDLGRDAPPTLLPPAPLQPPHAVPTQDAIPVSTSAPASAHTSHSDQSRVAIVLTVFKRSTLRRQLGFAAAQTLRPRIVCVVQNGDFIDVSDDILKFRASHPDIDLRHIASSHNLRFHGRFYIAYLLEDIEYVSIWDDDMVFFDECVLATQSMPRAASLHNAHLAPGTSSLRSRTHAHTVMHWSVQTAVRSSVLNASLLTVLAAQHACRMTAPQQTQCTTLCRTRHARVATTLSAMHGRFAASTCGITFPQHRSLATLEKMFSSRSLFNERALRRTRRSSKLKGGAHRQNRCYISGSTVPQPRGQTNRRESDSSVGSLQQASLPLHATIVRTKRSRGRVMSL